MAFRGSPVMMVGAVLGASALLYFGVPFAVKNGKAFIDAPALARDTAECVTLLDAERQEKERGNDWVAATARDFAEVPCPSGIISNSP